MKHLDKAFKEKLYAHKIEVPEGLWEKIAPPIEKESGRAAIWFWFTGVLALLILGLGLYLSSTDKIQNEPEIVPLVTNEIIPTPSTFSTSDNSKMTFTKVITNEEQVAQEENSPVLISDTPTKSNKSKNTPTTRPSYISPLLSAPVVVDNSPEIIEVKGKPAGLVITKSYISDNGAVIKKSNLGSDRAEKDSSYDVFFDSNDINAGALIRIIAPIKSIPLPAFSQLKKKLTLTTL